MDYFIKGFNASVISIGENSSLLDNEDGTVRRVLHQIFEYMKRSKNYLLGISAFSIHKENGKEIFEDLLTHSPNEDIVNVEIRTEMEAIKLIHEIYKNKDFIGHRFIRFMIYDIVSRTVSNLHLVSTICHPHVIIESVCFLIPIEI